MHEGEHQKYENKKEFYSFEKHTHAYIYIYMCIYIYIKQYK